MMNDSYSKNIRTYLRTNRFLTENNRPIPSLRRKYHHDSSKKFEEALYNLTEGLAEYSNEYLDEGHFKNSKSYLDYNYENIPFKKKSYSANKYKYLRSISPGVDLNKNILNHSNIKRSFYSNSLETKKNNNTRLTQSIHSRLSNTKKSKYEYYNDIKNIDKIYNININGNSRPREIIMLNNILKKQNKEFKGKIGEMRNKINELLNNLKMIRMDNQRLNNDRKKLIQRINYYEDYLNKIKNQNINELELKNNVIENLKDEIMKLKILLDKKDNEIVNLMNNTDNYKNYKKYNK